jgi:hypothetical protein
VIARTAAGTRWTRRLATLLLVLQGLAGGAVPLAHASERLTAPAHIESQHGAGCLALHDSLRCALCQYAGSLVTAPPMRAHAARGATVECPPRALALAPLGRREHATAPPRAPPSSRS